MDESDPKKEAVTPIIVILERRTQRQAELSSEDVMKIIRKRASKKGYNGGSGNSDAFG